MTKVRKVIACLVAVVMMFSMIFQAAFASPDPAGFSDVKGHWAEAQIIEWADKGVISGDNGKFRPDSGITRAEFCAVINRVFGFSEKSGTDFSDVKPGAWYADDVAIAKEAGYVSGYGNNKFGPNDKLTRQDAAKIFKELFKLEAAAGQNAPSFADSGDIATYARDAVAVLAAQRYISGSDNRFYPKKNISRAEVVTILDNTVEQLYAAAGTYSAAEIKGNVVVRNTDVILKDTVISGNLYLAEGVGQGTVTLNNVTVKGRTFVNGGGENSIVLENTTLGTLVIEKKNGKLRIVARGDTTTSNVQMNSGAKLQEEDPKGNGFGNVEIFEIPAGQQIVLDGDFDAVDIEAPGVSVQVADGTVGTLTAANGASGSNIQIAQGAAVGTLNANAPVNVSGQGRITTAKINSNGVVIAQTPSNIIITGGNTATVGGKPVTETTNSGNSGNSGDDGDDGDTPMWTLVWGDEFGGTALDTTKWRLEDKGDGFGNQELQYYRPENAEVRDGKLVITAKKESYGGNNYTSAKLFSKADWKYGKFEAKIKLPLGTGFWPAFWMMPADSVYGVWAASGEIDIMEAKGRLPGVASGTLHYGAAWPNNKYTGKEYTFPAGQTIDQFHTYTLEWEPGEIRWYIDGNLYQTQNNWSSTGADGEEKLAFPAPFDQNFYLMFNLAIGGTFDGGLYPTDDKFPEKMEVDYVRVYELTGKPYKTPVEPSVEKEPLPEGARQPDENGNLVYDVNFDNGIKENAEGVDADFGEGWNFIHNAAFGGAATATVDNIGGKNYAKIDVTNKGSQTYAVQLEQHTTLGKGRWYEFSFDAKADKARTLIADLSGGPTGGWAKYSDAYTANLTTDFQNFKYKFQMTRDSDILTRIEFNCATDTGAVYIGNVSVKEVDPPTVDYNASKDPLPVSGNYIYNGTFDKYLISRMAYWNVTKTGAAANVYVPEATRELTADITDGRTAAGALTLDQKGVQLQNGNGYKLSFKARAAAGRTIKVKLASKDGATAYLPEQEITLTTSMQTFEVPFAMEAATDNESQLVFLLGGNDSDVYIDDVSLIKTTIDYSQIDMYPLKNGDFSNGLDKWGNWAGEGGSAAVSVEDGAAKIAISNAGTPPYGVQFYQDGLNMTKGMKYVVSFDAKSTKTRKIEISLEDSNYNRSFTRIIDIGTETTHFEETFTMTSDKVLSLKFLLGKTDDTVAGLGAHDIFIDNVICEVKNAKFLTSVVQNGQFNSELAPWAAWTGDGGAADVSAVNGEMKIGVTNVGPNSWSVQVFQEGLKFENGQKYQVSFKAKADTARKINVNIGKALTTDPWFIPYMPMQTYSLTDTMQEFTYEFTMNEATYNNSKIVFEAGNVTDGNAATNIYIDDVAVNKVVVAAVATPTFSPAAGSFINEKSVTVNCATPGATIRYTTDGSTPTASSAIYSAPITITQTTTIKAYAVKDGMPDSEVASATYTKSVTGIDGDIVVDGGFDEGMGLWDKWFGDQYSGYSEGTVAVDNNKLMKINVQSIGGTSYSPQVFREGLTLTNGKTYTVSFDAKASVARKMNVNIGNPLTSDPWFTNYAATNVVDLTTEMKNYTYQFTVTQPTLSTIKMVLEVGNVTGGNASPADIYIDNVSIKDSENTEVISDGTFEDGTVGAWKSWWGDQWSGTSTGEVSVVNDGRLKADITSIGSASYSPQIFRPNLTLENCKTYNLSFKAKASVARKMNVNIGNPLNSDPWFTNYAPTQVVDLTTEMKTYNYTFKVAEPTCSTIKLVYEMGNVTGGNASPVVIYLDDVTVKPVSEAPEAQLATKWYLYVTPVDGVTPAGETLQAGTTTAAMGWQPVKVLSTTAASCWYSPVLNGAYTAGDWSFTLWTDQQAVSTSIDVGIYIADGDGSNAQLVSTATADVKGDGNHSTTFSFAGISEKTLTNQRLMVQIAKHSDDGKTVTICYNPMDVFKTFLATPPIK